MKPLVLLTVLLVFGVSVQAEPRFTEIEFEPADFVPGDKVSLLARFDPAGLAWDEAWKTTGFPESAETDPTIVSAAIERRAGAPVLVVQFIAWQAGFGQLPSLSVGGLAFPAIKFEAMSSLGADTSPPRARSQLEPPGLRMQVYLVSGLLLAIALATVVFLSMVLPWLKRLKARFAFIRVRKEFDGALALLADWNGPTPEAWAVLCGSLRRFLEARTLLPWPSMTPLEAGLLRETSISAELLPEITCILSEGDEVRFAGRQDHNLSARLSLARGIADRLDQAMGPVPSPGAGGRQ